MTKAESEAVFYRGQHITPNDAARFMNEKSAGDQSCEVCKSTDWLTAFSTENGEHAHFPTLKFKGEDRVPGKTSMHVFLFICANCGHIRAHSMAVLAAWLKARDQGDEQEQENE